MRFSVLSDIMGQGRVAIGGDIVIKQMDEGEGDAFILTSLDMISRAISPGRPGQIQTYSPNQIKRPEFIMILLSS
jgi:hypothetical protein